MLKIAYNAWYVPRGTSQIVSRETLKTAYEKLARDPYEYSAKHVVRRQKTET